VGLVRYFIGLDLGQAQDFTAVAVLTRPRLHGNERGADKTPPYDVPHLHRFPLGTPYPAIVASMIELLSAPPLRGCMFVVDQTGVGRAVVDMLTEAMKGKVNCSFCPITITGGQEVTRSETKQLRVPKKELVGCLQVLLQTRRLRVAKALPDAAVLVRELETFRVKITDAANETFGAWREGQHDDLLLAVALAAWMGEETLPEGPVGLPKVIGGSGEW
jgi:hypothetical protein